MVAVLACITSVPLLSQPTQGRAQTLDRATFTILKCPEGEVTCEDVAYRAESKRTKRSVNLKGSTSHSMCEDKVTPRRFLGYIVKRDTFTYPVSDEGELIVRDGENVIVQESGAGQ
jgi:DNA-binding transcriptional regulator YdaS (Cro superfamily)